MTTSTDQPSTGRQLSTLVDEVAGRTARTANSVSDDLRRRLRPLAEGVEQAVSTAIGQSRSAAERAIDAVDARRHEASGQVRAQTRSVADDATRARVGLLDDATNAIADGPGATPAALEDRTKAELYDEARRRDIDGRSTMTKAELVTALRR